MTTFDDPELESVAPDTLPDVADLSAFIERLLPDVNGRTIILKRLIASIRIADQLGANRWGLTVHPAHIRLNVGSYTILEIMKDSLWLALDPAALKASDLPRLHQLEAWKDQNYKSFTESAGGIIALQDLDTILPIVNTAHEQAIQAAAARSKTFHSRMRKAHSEAVLTYIRDTMQERLPSPKYDIPNEHSDGNRGVTEDIPRDGGEQPTSINIGQILAQQLIARGLSFTSWQIATFYTALQAKGFVILSGISGIGKTKLAQHFAELLPQPGAAAVPVEREDELIAITLKPYMFKYNRLIIPKQATRFFDPPKPGESKDVELTFDGQSQVCRLTHAEYSDTDYVALMLRGSAGKWFKQTFKPDDTLTMEPEFDAKQDLVGFRLANGAAPALPNSGKGTLASGSTPKTNPSVSNDIGTNWLFIPVRPDWRDSKSLLGYFNPLTVTYVWTDFLRFLVRAAHSYRNGDGIAWFVILDEMNLARVEYYFADLLSVLESGRTSDGWSREALRLDYPTTSDGDLPPRELRLPPSLAFIGTVNMDETTHAFSPKVLDRAFTIEFIEADFKSYPPAILAPIATLTPQLQNNILQLFSQNGQFQRVSKDRIAAYITSNPKVRDHLQSLNALLQPYSMHFGFRVFDEIVPFLAAADDNGLFDDVKEPNAAFDAAVLMKVLPKFHGSRGKLEAPLRAVLAWCVNPITPDSTAIKSTLEKFEAGQAAVQALQQLSYQYPRTATRIARMIWSLYTDGFASFG